MKEGDRHLLTTSYDGTVQTWSQANMNGPMDVLEVPGKALWEIKFNQKKEHLAFGIPAIYDGYIFG